MALYDELKSRLAFKDDPAWPTYDKAEAVLVVLSQTSAAILTMYRKLRGNPTEQAELSAAIQRLHDEEIKPLDLPGVGPWVEPFIDNNLGSVLGALVAPADAALDKILPNPVE